MELADRDTLVAQVGLTDDEASMDRLVSGILAALSGPPGLPRPPGVPSPSIPPAPMTPRAAFFAPHETVARTQALGRLSAELIAPYPPGVPVVVPGERITSDTLDVLAASLAAGNRIAYAADPTLGSLQVIPQE